MYLLALHLLSQKIGVLSGGDLKLEVHVCLQHRLQPHGLRPAAADCQHVHTEGILQSGLLVQKVHEIFRIRILAKLYDDTDPFLGGLIGYIHNVLRLLCLRQPGHIGKKFGDIHTDHGVWNFCDDHIGLSTLEPFKFHLAPNLDLSHTGLINLQKLILVGDNAPGGKIRPLHIAHKPCGGDAFIPHIGLHGVYNLPQIVGRGAGDHTYGDPFGTVHQKVRNLNGKDGRLLLRLVEIGHEIYHVLVQIPQKSLLCDLLKSGLRVTHGSSPVPFDVAEVAVSVHQRKFLLKILTHNYQSIIDRAVAVRMVFTHGVSHDTGALSVGSVIADPQLVHIIEGAPLDGLQPVPHIRQGPCDNSAHGIVYEGLLHLLGIFRFYDSVIIHLSFLYYCQISSWASTAWL